VVSTVVFVADGEDEGGSFEDLFEIAKLHVKKEMNFDVACEM
jgi:hypothetical protein